MVNRPKVMVNGLFLYRHFGLLPLFRIILSAGCIIFRYGVGHKILERTTKFKRQRIQMNHVVFTERAGAFHLSDVSSCHTKNRSKPVLAQVIFDPEFLHFINDGHIDLRFADYSHSICKRRKDAILAHRIYYANWEIDHKFWQ